jgi:YD repeat-containing protein
VLNARGVTLLDVDGDGMSDLARLDLGDQQYRKNLGGRFADPRALSGAGDASLEGIVLMDVDGDARADMVRVIDDTWRVDRLVGETWQRVGPWAGSLAVPLQSSSSVLADVNGDGRTDVIRGRAAGLLINFGADGGLTPGVAQPRIQPNAEVEPGNANVRFTDMNGDGLADVVWLTDNWMKVLLGRGDGTFVPFAYVPWPWLASGQNPAVDLRDLFLADLDRDGLVDLVRFSAGHMVWYPGLPDAHLSTSVRTIERPENVDADAVVTVADVDGNGSADVVWSSPRGMWALDIAGDGSAGMLSSISNGLGKTTSFSYTPSALLAVEAEQAGKAWEQKLPVSVPVPVSTRIDPGGGTPPRTVRYGVRDGFWDGFERRFGGFLESDQAIAADRNEDVKYEQTFFNAGLGVARALRGKPRMVRVSNGRGDLLSITVNDWEALPVTGLPDSPLTRKAAVRETVVSTYEGQATPAMVRTTVDYDGDVRPTVETQLGTDLLGDERVTKRSYASDDVNWIRDRVYFEEVTDGAGTLASRSQTYFGGPTGAPLGLGAVGAGLVRRTDAYLAEDARWITQSSRDYDGCGNPIVIYEGGVQRSIGYDTACLHPTSETLSPGGGAAALTWTLAWDNVIGQPLAMSDPNGDTTQVTYDELGRQTSLASNGGPAHARFIYDWTAPRPRNTTCTWDGMLATAPAGGAGCPGGAGWRTVVAVVDGAGEDLYASTAVGDGRFVISGWKERDDRGLVTLQAEPFYATVPYPDVRPASGVRLQTFHFDALGRLDLETLPNGAQKTITYAPLKRTLASSETAPVVSFSDGLGRVVRTERSVEIGTESVDASYDAAGRILAMTLQKGPSQVVHAFAYDTLGRLRHGEDPDTGPRDLTYDDGNFLRQHKNGAGQTVYFDYDAAGRLVRRGETASPAAATDYAFKYDDPASALASTGCHPLGRLSSVREPAGDAHLCFDQLGRQTGVGRNITAAAGTKSASEASTLAASGLVLETQADDGFLVGYKYDGAGRTVCVRTPPATDPAKCRTLPGTATDDYWVADEIDAAGRVRREHYGNGVIQTYDHDQLGLAQHVQVTSPGGGAAANLFEVMVTRNSYGAPTVVADLDGQHLDHSATYSYDLAARLTDATMGPSSDRWAFTYHYDALQNMTLRKVMHGGARADIGALAGVYRYGERGYGPRQLTSVVPEAAP